MSEIIRIINDNCTLDLELECQFLFEGDDVFDYICDGRNIMVNSQNVRVSSIKGIHKTGFSNENVTALRIISQPMKYLPRNLGFFFPNLERLTITQTGLKEMRYMEELTKLREISMEKNNLTEFNEHYSSKLKGLESLSLSNNAIRKLSSFEEFTNLRTIDLGHNL